MSTLTELKPAARVRCKTWLERAGWSCEEAGWWTHEKHGGICIERDGKWWVWPLQGRRRGPFKTAYAAARSNDGSQRPE